LASFFSRFTGGNKSPPLVAFHESSLEGPCSYKQLERNTGGYREGEYNKKKTEKNKN
jgi:hypothetical protein